MFFTTGKRNEQTTCADGFIPYILILMFDGLSVFVDYYSDF
jgi:hypothetical protein